MSIKYTSYHYISEGQAGYSQWYGYSQMSVNEQILKSNYLRIGRFWSNVNFESLFHREVTLAENAPQDYLKGNLLNFHYIERKQLYILQKNERGPLLERGVVLAINRC